MKSYIKGDAVENATSYELLEKHDGNYNLLATANEINFEVSVLGLAEGNHILVVKAKADGYEDSDYSNEVVYTNGTSTTPEEPEEPEEPDTPVAPAVITSLEDYETHPGYMSGTGAWNNINEKYAHVVVPVSEGTVVEVTADAILYYAGLRSYSGAVDGEAVDLSESVGWTGRNSVSAGTSKTLIVPSDVKYLVFFVINNTKVSYPTSIKITIGG